MAPVTMPPVEEARAIFSRLGYTVSGDGAELQAERKWRTVHVTALAGEDTESAGRALADGGREESELRCFVTWREYTGELRERLESRGPPYEWAVIGVDDEEEYEVCPDGVTTATV